MNIREKLNIKRLLSAALIVWLWASTFAGNVIGDVPSSANENREIQKESSLYSDSCDISQDLAFYDWSPVFLRVAQPKWPASYVFDKTETYIRLYGDAIFSNNLKFPYISNFIPSVTLDTVNSNILTVEAKDGVFSWQTNKPRNQVAGQIVTKNMLRSIIQNANGSTLNYYYVYATNDTTKNWSIKVIINTQITEKTSCTHYYVARCGDGIIDKESWSSDGNGWIQTSNAWFIERHPRSIKPNEVCDDGPDNGKPGKCKIDCSGFDGGWPVDPVWASCSLSASASNIQQGQSVTINASYTSGTAATFTPTLVGMDNFTYPTWNGTASDTPNTTTTYTLTVQWEEWTNPAVCTTIVTVTEPTPHLECTLTVTPTSVFPGEIVSLWWNVSNGNFVWTHIYVDPAVQWAPHRINANQYNGVTTVSPSSTGTHIASLTVFNDTETYTCTGEFFVEERVPGPSHPLCQLVAVTPKIISWQTATLSWRYTYGTLATMSPSIPWLNFVYPHRSNSAITVTPTETTTYSLHVIGTWWTRPITCNAIVEVTNPQISFNKSLVTNVLYKPGDLVSFKINFANVGTSSIDNVIISDYLPLSLEYVTSQISNVAPYTFATGTVWGHHFVQYSWFSLAAWQQGHIILVGRFKWYQFANQTLNNAFFRADGIPLTYASALFYAHTPSANATVTKSSNKPTYYPGEAAQFTIAVTNNGPDAINNMTITDDRPAGSCVVLDPQWASNVPLTVGSSTNPYTWIYNGNLWVGQTIYLYLTGNISNNHSCVGSYTNNANINYTINNEVKTWVAPWLPFTISLSPSSTMIFEKRLISYGNNSGDPVVFELLYHNQGNATISNFNIVDYRPWTLNFVSASPMPTTQTPMVGWTELRRIINTPLAPNAEGKITIQWTIK